MANRRNAIIKIRKDKKRTQRNRMIKSEVRSLLKNFEHARQTKDTNKSEELVKELYSKLDKALKKGIFKENAVSRKKSRITRALNLIKA